MKKYEKPKLEIIELRINERIAANNNNSQGCSNPALNGNIHSCGMANDHCS
jgi:hypothetical protein